jgi:hypothetical protein
MTETDNLAIDRIEHLVDRANHFAKAGDSDMREFFLAEAKILAMVMDGADDVFKMLYHRHQSDSYGIDFEITHGDPELMFGGV